MNAIELLKGTDPTSERSRAILASHVVEFVAVNFTGTMDQFQLEEVLTAIYQSLEVGEKFAAAADEAAIKGTSLPEEV